MADIDDNVAVGLTYDDTLPLSWVASSQLPDEQQIAHLNYSNLHVLQAVEALEERIVEPDEEDAKTLHALARFDSKLNLLLDLVGKLAAQSAALPPRVSVRIGSSSLFLRESDVECKQGDVGVASIYLRASPATPLRVAGRVENAQTEHGQTELQVSYVGLDEAVQDTLDRMIFRRHRRLIAQRQMHAFEA